ncbi:MAG: nucleotidyl transferase AbiEii/AbiGii toxin family protein [Bacteroidetes bacterium]|nr:nucleotidyl transferase AbiEii/AbiGii toxin family protein [Bacteroidota bacterium]
MIHKESHTSNWIKKVAKAHNNADEILVEKVIRALTLLEGLKESGLDFIFKGGTALMLLLPEIKRLSIDIDIIMDKKPENLEKLFEKLIKEKEFTGFKEQERKTKSKISKAHYKFFYSPVTNTRAKEEYVLLDILFEKNPYGKLLKETEIKSPFIKTDGKKLTTRIPAEEAILGDKLTAYAPNTTGVRYNSEKEIEIIKQLYDIGNLFDQINNMASVKSIFNQIGKTELAYRELTELTHESILEDIYQTSLCLSLRGQDGQGNFSELQTGIQNIVNFIISENFHIEKAITHASKAAYLSVLIKKDIAEIKRYGSPADITEIIIASPFNTKLNKLKKSNPEAFFYWYHATSLLKP